MTTLKLIARWILYIPISFLIAAIAGSLPILFMIFQDWFLRS